MQRLDEETNNVNRKKKKDLRFFTEVLRSIKESRNTNNTFKKNSPDDKEKIEECNLAVQAVLEIPGKSLSFETLYPGPASPFSATSPFSAVSLFFPSAAAFGDLSSLRTTVAPAISGFSSSFPSKCSSSSSSCIIPELLPSSVTVSRVKKEGETKDMNKTKTETKTKSLSDKTTTASEYMRELGLDEDFKEEVEEKMMILDKA